MGRALACLARTFRAVADGLSPGESAVGSRPQTPSATTSATAPALENDILWRAKRNAFRQALSQHGVTEAEACAILRLLVASGRGGCELGRLADLTGLETVVLDRAVPLMGLQNIVAIEERTAGGQSRPVVWVAATDAGRRFVREAASAFFAALEAPAGVLPEPGDGSPDGPRNGVAT